MRKQLIGALGAASLAACGAALAQTLVGTPTNASGINGVVVVGFGTYDVSFGTSSFDSTFSTASSANDASSALADDLNRLSVTGLRTGSGMPFDCTMQTTDCFIFAGSSNQLADTAFYGSKFPEHRWNAKETVIFDLGPACPETIGGTTACLEAAQWTKVGSSAPEPATLALLGLGLVGLGLFRRRLAR